MYNIRTINSIRDKLLAAKETIAVAESVTSGHLQAAFSMADNARMFFQGGITVYNLGQKCRHLQVDPVVADACNSVSEAVSATMANQVCKMFLSTWGIGITGYATPLPAEGITERFAFYSIACNGQTVCNKMINAPEKEPMEVQLFYVDTALKDLESLLKKSGK